MALRERRCWGGVVRCVFLPQKEQLLGRWDDSTADEQAKTETAAGAVEAPEKEPEAEDEAESPPDTRCSREAVPCRPRTGSSAETSGAALAWPGEGPEAVAFASTGPPPEACWTALRSPVAQLRGRSPASTSTADRQTDGHARATRRVQRNDA